MKSKDESIKIKCLMHTPLNLLTIPVLLIMFVFAGFFILRDAIDDTARVIVFLCLILFFVLSCFLFLKVFRILDWLVFTENEVERHSLFGKKVVYQYSELYACIGIYVSVIEEKKYIIFSPKKLNIVAVEIYTRKFGNINYVNRNKIVYCAISDELMKLLRTKEELQWVNYTRG